MNYDKTTEIFERIVVLETTIGELYQLCSTKWEEDKEFWLTLSEQEKIHAEHAKQMKQIFLQHNEGFTVNNNFPLMAVDSIILYISGIITKLKTECFTKKQMLNIARDTENSLMETNYQRIATTTNPEYTKLVNILMNQTMEHKKLITDKIKLEARS